MRALKNISIILLILFPVVLFAQKPVEIKGIFTNNKFTKVELKSAYNDDDKIYSTSEVATSGAFLLKATIAQPDIYRLVMSEQETVLCILAPGEKIEIELDADNLSAINSVKGSNSMIFIKNITQLLNKAQGSLDHFRNLLNEDQAQLYYNAFNQKNATYFQTNIETNQTVTRLLEATKNLNEIATRYSKNGAADPKQADSLIFMAATELKTIKNRYQAYNNYLQNIKPNYNIFADKSANYGEFNQMLEQYNQLLEEYQMMIATSIDHFAKECGALNDTKENYSLDDLLKNKKAKMGLANGIVSLSNQYGVNIANAESNFTDKAQTIDKLSRDVLTFSQGEISKVVARYQQLFNMEKESLDKMVKDSLLTYKDDLAVIMFMDYFPKDKNIDLHKEIITALNTKYPTNKAVQERHTATMAAAVSSNVGAMAPELAFLNPEDKTLKLSDLKGKYVLIDFWASWCGPCRRENPHVVSLYNKYKDKGFEVFSVSLDNNAAAWTKAIEADKLSWTNHVSDLKGWSSAAAKLYGVNSIPATFLVDKEGRIVAKNLRGQELTNILQSIFEE